MSSKSGGAKSSRKEAGIKVVADNRRARFDYEIIDTFEAGIELKGPEVKSLREGRANIGESYASVTGGEAYFPGHPGEVVSICERIARDMGRPVQ